jgi:two-component system repressor protein LuxO
MAMHQSSAGHSSGRLLLIDGDERQANLALDALNESLGSAVRVVMTRGGRESIELLRRENFDVVLVDLASLKDLSDRNDEAMGRVARCADGALLIALSDGTSVSAAVEAMRAGAHDYVVKPINGAAMAARIGELAQRHGKASAISLNIKTDGLADYCGFIGASSAMQFVYEQIGRIASSSAPVFITGESGTGKDVCAEALHEKSARGHKRLVAINCAAIPRDLMESELFGVARGAYTGAHEDRKGAVEMADGGTLFLDEIGEMDLSLQSKLLRFLQTGTMSRVGESGVRHVDVRVICATNRNPMQMISEKKFREDLFYRLHVLPIHLPPLRQRPTDIMVLARHFLGQYGTEEGKRFADFTQDAANQLAHSEWPGNVRQLQNVVRRLVVMFDGGEITLPMLQAADIESRGVAVAVAPTTPRGERRQAILPMWQQEQRIIEDAIASFGGNISLAAAALEISPSTIYRKRQGWAELSVAS